MKKFLKYLCKVLYKIFKRYIFERASKDSSKFADYVKKLVKYGVDVDVRDKDGNTPLLIACMYKDIEIVHELIKARADVNVVNKDGDTPLKIACKEGDGSVIEELLTNGYGLDVGDLVEYLKIPYVQNEDRSLVGKLIERGANYSKIFNEENEEYGRMFIEWIDNNFSNEINKLNDSINEAYITSVCEKYKAILEEVSKDLVRMNEVLNKLEKLEVSEALANEFNNMCNKNRKYLSNQNIFYKRCKAKNCINLKIIPECTPNVNKSIQR